jgi:hypothetical protein
MATEGIQINDFTGGLNYRADAYQLADNESPDLLNVDVDPRGGFSQRTGFSDYNSAAIGGIGADAFAPSRAFAWDGNARQLLLSANNKVFWTEDGTFTDIGVTVNATHGAQFAPWHNSNVSYVYGSAGESNAVFKWNGTILNLLTSSGTGRWQATNAAGTHAPRCEHITTHADRVWAGYVHEWDGAAYTSYPDRIRFSQAGLPESWRELDYIDVVGGGRGITSIVSFGDQLLVFKPRAVFAVLGYDEDTFQLVQLTNQAGAVSPQAVAATERNVFFFSWPQGLFTWDGSSFTDLFTPMRPVLDSGDFNDTSLDGVYLSYVGRKVHLSLPVGVDPDSVEDYDQSGFSFDDDELKYDGAVRADVPTSTFVWDETVGSGGAWVRYKLADGYGFAGGADWVDASGLNIPVFLHPVKPWVLRAERDAYQDTIGGVAADMESYYVTKWQDAGTTSLRKFWRRPQFLVRQLGADTQLTVDVFHDWDRTVTARTFTLDFTGAEFSGGYESWVQPDLGSDLVKGSNLGLASAVQLKVSGPSGKPWGVNGITYKFNPRRSRI